MCGVVLSAGARGKEAGSLCLERMDAPAQWIGFGGAFCQVFHRLFGGRMSVDGGLSRSFDGVKHVRSLLCGRIFQAPGDGGGCRPARCASTRPRASRASTAAEFVMAAALARSASALS